MRHFGTNSAPSVSAENEELRDIQIAGSPDRFRTPLYENKPRQLSLHSDEEWQPASVAPIERELRIAEPAFLPDLQFGTQGYADVTLGVSAGTHKIDLYAVGFSHSMLYHTSLSITVN